MEDTPFTAENTYVCGNPQCGATIEVADYQKPDIAAGNWVSLYCANCQHKTRIVDGQTSICVPPRPSVAESIRADPYGS